MFFLYLGKHNFAFWSSKDITKSYAFRGKKKKVSFSCFSSPRAKLLNVVKDSMGGDVILLGNFVVCFCLVVF